MVKVFIAPRRYVQGVGVLADIGKYIAPLGKRALVAWGPVVSQLFGTQVEQSLKAHSVEPVLFTFRASVTMTRSAWALRKPRPRRLILWSASAAAKPSTWPKRWR